MFNQNSDYVFVIVSDSLITFYVELEGKKVTYIMWLGKFTWLIRKCRVFGYGGV